MRADHDHPGALSSEHADDVNFTRLELWVDRKTDLPVRVRTRDASKNVTTATFRDIRTTETIDSELFEMSKPIGWDLTVERMQPKTPEGNRP